MHAFTDVKYFVHQTVLSMLAVVSLTSIIRTFLIYSEISCAGSLGQYMLRLPS